jgi:hypothetical protein
MKTASWISLLAGVVCVSAATTSVAADKPVNLSLFTPISIAKETDSVWRSDSIYCTKNTSVKVVDIGLVNHTTSGLEGPAAGCGQHRWRRLQRLQVSTVNYNPAVSKDCGVW